MRKLIKTTYNFIFLSCVALITSGCGGGGGGGSLGFLGDIFGSSSAGSTVTGAGGSAVTSGGSTSLATVHSPEPSSLILLCSGLIGMAIYTKARMKIKSKNKR